MRTNGDLLRNGPGEPIRTRKIDNQRLLDTLVAAGSLSSAALGALALAGCARLLGCGVVAQACWFGEAPEDAGSNALSLGVTLQTPVIAS